MYAVAASDGERKAVMIVNHAEEARRIRLNTDQGMIVYLIDQEHFIAKTDLVVTDFIMEPNQVVLIRNYEGENVTSIALN